MENIPAPQSPTNATYVEPSSETILEPGLKLGDLLHRNMTQPYVLQRLRKRVWWVQSFNYGTVFYVGDRGVLIFDTHGGHLSALPRRSHRRHRPVRRRRRARRNQARDHRQHEDSAVDGPREEQIPPAHQGAEVASR